MKQFTRIGAFLLVFACMNQFAFSQNKTKSIKHPTSFTIDKTSLDQLFSYKVNTVTTDKTNKFINGSTMLINSSYKENKQLKLKLSYFKNAELYVQVNGKDSKILYILSSDDSVFYNSKETDKGFTMTLCQKDDILSE